MRTPIPTLVAALVLASTSAWAQTRPDAPGPAASPNGSSATTGEGSAPDSPNMSLRDAYKREFAFLAGQKRQLAERLGQVERQTREEDRKLQAEIQALESKLLGLEAKNQSTRESLVEAEQTQMSSTDDEQLVEATLQQALATLTDYEVELTEADGDKSQQLVGRFEKAVELLERLSTVTRSEGSFFQADGTKVTGQIVRVGRVAAYGVSEQAAGALAPAGGGRLKIWKDPSSSTARALASGESPESLSIFLFESLDSQVDDGKGETMLEHVASGGSIGWVIVALGGLGLLLVGIRAFLLGRAASDTSSLERTIESLVGAGRYGEAIEHAKRTRGSAARVVASLLAKLSDGVEDVEDVVSESILRESRRIQRFGAIILVIAAVAPLLGLLGTVTGMISTFDVITKYGTGDPKMLSGGISTALVTTELGLIVAIPTLLLGNLLRGWGEGIESDMERVVLRVVNVHKEARQGPESGQTRA